MIYLLEDDQSIREFMLYSLSSQGLEAQGFELPSEFWRAMENRIPDLAVLDIMLPEEDGLSVLRHLRASAETARLPVMMVTAKGTEYDKVLGLDAGADDYLAKPFGMMEFLSRIRALLRRAGPLEREAEYRAGELYVCPAKHIIRAEGKPVTLTIKEFEILCLLVTHMGVVFSREQLIEKIWGYAFDGESRTVDVHIRTLRQKLGPCGGCIETVRGMGYKIEEPAR